MAIQMATSEINYSLVYMGQSARLQRLLRIRIARVVPDCGGNVIAYNKAKKGYTA